MTNTVVTLKPTGWQEVLMTGKPSEKWLSLQKECFLISKYRKLWIKNKVYRNLWIGSTVIRRECGQTLGRVRVRTDIGQ